MAFNDTLFQLGMDLTRSSTAQKEEFGEVALSRAHSDETAQAKNTVKPSRSSTFRSMEQAVSSETNGLTSGTPTIGTHVTIDIHGDVALDDFKTAVSTLTRLVDDAGASLQHLHVHPVADSGAISGVAVLSNGHIAFHSRPVAGYAALDISTFGGSTAQIWTLAAKAAFEDCRISVRIHPRGEAVSRLAVGSGTKANGALLAAVLPARRSVASRAVRAKAA